MQLIGKEYTFQIEITSDNVLLNSKIFKVTDAYQRESSTTSSSYASIPGFNISSYSEVSHFITCFVRSRSLLDNLPQFSLDGFQVISVSIIKKYIVTYPSDHRT